MVRITNCQVKRAKRHRLSLSITIDPHVLQALKNWMKREGETNISAVIEGFIDCGVRDTCDGCPYAEEGTEKAGIGKVAAEEKSEG